MLNKQERHFDPANYAEEILADPSTGLFFSFYVIIGMREDITKEKRQLKNMYRNNHNIEIGSYDRFLDTAKNLYGSK